jgi:hypothetical protein
MATYAKGEEMTKPLSEWLKDHFGIQLGNAAKIIKNPRYRISVNGILTKNMSFGVKKGDKIIIAGKEHLVDWKSND